MDNLISVIIPTLNRPESLKNTMNSYFKGTKIPEQFIIIDQSDNEDIRNLNKRNLEVFEKRAEIIYICQEEKSSTHSRNRGILEAKNDIIIFSDDDIEVEIGTIENLLSVMSDDKISMVAVTDTLSTNGKTNPLLSYFFAKKSFKKRNMGYVTKSVLGRFPDKQIDSIVETEWAQGYFFAIRRENVIKWNAKFDEKLCGYAYAEDLDFSHYYWHMSKEDGKRCVISKDVNVKHLASLEYRIPNELSTVISVINREYFFYKHNIMWKEYSRFLLSWSYCGDVLFRVLRKQNASYLCHAIKVARKHRAELKQLQLKKEWYEE